MNLALDNILFFTKKLKKTPTKTAVEGDNFLEDKRTNKITKSHRSEHKQFDNNKQNVDKSLILSDNKEYKHRVKNFSENTKFKHTDGKFKAEEKNKKRSVTKTHAIDKTNSVFKDPNNGRNEHLTRGVEFDQNIEQTVKQDSKVTQKYKITDQTAKIRSSILKTGSKYRNVDDKSNYLLIRDNNNLVSAEDKSKYNKSNPHVKTRVQIKENVDIYNFDSSDQYQVKGSRKKEHIDDEHFKRHNSKASDFTHLENSKVNFQGKPKMLRKIRKMKDPISRTNELTKVKGVDRESKEFNKKRDQKDREHKKKKRDKAREISQVEQLNNVHNKKLDDPTSDNHHRSGQENGFLEKTHKERHHSETGERKQQREGKKFKSNLPDQREGNKIHAIRRKSKHCISEIESAIGTTEIKDAKIQKKKKFKDGDNSPPLTKRKKEFDVSEDNSVDILKNDKCILLDNKEDVLMKGMQELTVKELYLMENLKEYEIKLNEQYLKKIKKKKQHLQSISDTTKKINHEDKSTIQPITNLPICRLPSVKEIFQLSNLADYEMKYKEVQDSKSKKHMNVKVYENCCFTPPSRRKKINKFSLASKDEETNIEEDNASQKISELFIEHFKSIPSENEGNGENAICNLGWLYNKSDSGTNKEKPMETGDANFASAMKVISRGNRTNSETSPKVGNIKNCIIESSYSKLCEKFHKDIREDSKRLLQILAEKNFRVSVKDSSLQSIKKKPSLSSNEDLCLLKCRNYKFVMTKKSKTDFQDYLPTTKNLTRVMEPTDIGQKEDIDISSNHLGNIAHNSSQGISSNHDFNSGDLFDKKNDRQYYSLGIILNSFQSSNAESNQNMSVSSFCDSMVKDDLKRNETFSEADLLKRPDFKNNQENNIVRQPDKKKSRLRENCAWFQRSPTLETFLNEIEEYPEKDNDPACKVQREEHIENKCSVLSDFEDSKNVMFHINSNNCDGAQKTNSNDIFKGIRSNTLVNDNLTKDNNLLLNEQTHRESVCLQNELDFMQHARLQNTAFFTKLVCKKSSKSTVNSKGDKRNESLESAISIVNNDLESKETNNDNNTKVVISHPNKKNILQIQFCGKLNINFNKDNIELGTIETSEFEENGKPLEIKIVEDDKIKVDRTKHRLEKIHSKISCPDHQSSENVLPNIFGLHSSQTQSESSSGVNTFNVSNSSNSIVCEGKRDRLIKAENANSKVKKPAFEMLDVSRPKGKHLNAGCCLTTINAMLKESPKLIDLRILDEIESFTTKNNLNNITKGNYLGESYISAGNERNVFKNENMSKTIERKCQTNNEITNLDACVQTVLDSLSHLNLNKPNKLLFNVETFTSPTFESKLPDYKNETSNHNAIKGGEKSNSWNTNDTCYSSEGMIVGGLGGKQTSKNDVNTPIKESEKSAPAEFSQEKDSYEITSSSRDFANTNLRKESPTISKQSTMVNVISDSSRNFSSGSGDTSGDLNNPRKKCESIKLKIPEDCHQKESCDKKKLLSHSEEETFNNNLLKGIGHDDRNENKSHINMKNKNKNRCPNAIFSALKKRLEFFRSKTNRNKINCGQYWESSKSKKMSTPDEIPNNFSPCPCSHENLRNQKTLKTMIVDLNCRKKILREPKCLNRSNIENFGPNYFKDQSGSDNHTGIKINDNHSISEFDLTGLGDKNLKKCPYFLGNYSRNSRLHLYSSVSDNKVDYLVSDFLNENIVENPQGIGEMSSFQFENRSKYFCNDRNNFMHQSSWAEDKHRRNAAIFPSRYSIKRRISDNLSSGQHPYKRYTCNTLQCPYSKINHPQQLSFSNCARQSFINNTCSYNDFNKIHRYRPVGTFFSDNIHRTNNLTEDNSNNMAEPKTTDAAQDMNLDNEEKKKSKKRTFSKRALKIWNGLFGTRKHWKEVFEYDDVSPEHFIRKHPKVIDNKFKIKKWLKKISHKPKDFQYLQEKLFKKLNKSMTSELTMPLQEVFDIIQKPQFQKDNVSYSGRRKFDNIHTCNYLSDDGHYVLITEKLNVRGFLVSIGLKDDVAWEAEDNVELNKRLRTAITEARSWANKITMTQGLLIYILAVMSPSEVINYCPQIVEAVINLRITSVGTLLSVMMVLKRYERGKYGIRSVVSTEQMRDIVPKQVSELENRHQENRTRFIHLYTIAKQAAKKTNNKVDTETAGLLARLTASYSPGLKQYLSLIVHYIAQKIIKDQDQLAMAVAYLQNLNTKLFDKELFELNCGIPPNRVVIHRIPKRSSDKEAVVAESSSVPKSSLQRKPSTVDLLKEKNN